MSTSAGSAMPVRRRAGYDTHSPPSLCAVRDTGAGNAPDPGTKPEREGDAGCGVQDWALTVAGLSGILKESKGAIQSTLRGLKAKGYLAEELIRNDIGQILRREYIFREMPQTENPSMVNPEQQIIIEQSNHQTIEEMNKISPLFRNSDFYEEWKKFIRQRGERYTPAMRADDLASLEKYPEEVAVLIIRRAVDRGWSRAHFPGSGKRILESWNRVTGSDESVITRNQAVKQALKERRDEREDEEGKGGAGR